MAAVLLTLAQAKGHLRITLPELDPGDEDIQLKLDQAEATILRYLKDPITKISTVTADTAAEVTTLTPHGLISGVTYTITGTVTDPTINGAQVVTVTGLNTFTVPVTTTTGESESEGYVATPVWTSTTAPGNVTAAILLLLGSLYELRGDNDSEASERTWTAIERLLVMSRDPALA